MNGHRAEARIAAPVEQVWAVVEDVERWNSWTPTVDSVELHAAMLVVGARATVRQPRLRTAAQLGVPSTAGG